MPVTPEEQHEKDERRACRLWAAGQGIELNAFRAVPEEIRERHRAALAAAAADARPAPVPFSHAPQRERPELPRPRTKAGPKSRPDGAQKPPSAPRVKRLPYPVVVAHEARRSVVRDVAGKPGEPLMASVPADGTHSRQELRDALWLWAAAVRAEGLTAERGAYLAKVPGESRYGFWLGRHGQPSVGPLL